LEVFVANIRNLLPNSFHAITRP